MNDTSKLNCVIIHIGYQDYLKHNIDITSKNNNIFLIGDKSVKCLGNLPNVTYIDIQKYLKNDEILNRQKYFKNFSSNNQTFEWMCFSRMFILYEFMKERCIDRIFHIDSDNILLKDINEYPFKSHIAYILNSNFENKYRMSCSIHCGLLNMLFLKSFIDLYDDIYIHNNLSLIQHKINHHRNISNEYVNGGICDMTLYYLINKSDKLNITNLAEPILINNKKNVFINNINNSEGWISKEQYKINSNGVMELFIDDKDKTIEIYDIIHNEKIGLWNIHFQGKAKHLMKTYCTQLLNLYTRLIY